MRIDVTSWKTIHSEDRGINTKEWLEDPKTHQEALYKETQIKDTQESTYADYGESLVSDICALLDVPCARIELVERKRKSGCISYNFCSKENQDDLIEIGIVIQNARPKFDTKGMRDLDSGEEYCVEMILEGLESISTGKKNFAEMRKALLKDILVDSLIDHYDRNPSNISIVRNRFGVGLSKKYDNGTSLSISVPEEALKRYIDSSTSDHEIQRKLRESIFSKIGYLGRKYVKYPDLETFIFNYYYEDVKDFLFTVSEKFTDEDINQMLSAEKYSNLSDIHKRMISAKLKVNRDAMLDRYRTIYKKQIIDKKLYNVNARQNFLDGAKKGIIQSIIPEYAECVGKKDFDSDYESSLDIQIADKIQSVVDITQLARFFNIHLAPITKREKSLLKWTVIIENIQKATGNPDIAQQILTGLGFLREDINVINALIKGRFVDENDVFEARDLIYGEKGIGEENINLYIAKKFVDATNMRKDLREQRIDELRIFINTLKECMELEKIVHEKLPTKARVFRRNGLTDSNKIIQIQYELARAYQANPRMDRKEILALANSYTEEILKDSKIEIAPGQYVEESVVRDINEHTYTLQNGEKLVLFNMPARYSNVAMKMGADYYGQICAHHSGDGVTMTLITKKGGKFPEAVSDFARRTISKYGTARIQKGSFVLREPQTKREVGLFVVSSTNDPNAKIPNVTVEEMTEKLIDIFNGKIRPEREHV